MRTSIPQRLLLIPLGIVLGFIAIALFGDPNADTEADPFRPNEALLELDLTDQSDSTEPEHSDETGLVPPLHIPGLVLASPSPQWQDWNRQLGLDPFRLHYDAFVHGGDAAFHAHGEQLCASGCAASHHPTRPLTSEHFASLMRQFQQQPLDETSPALEELLYFGPQARQQIEQHGYLGLDPARSRFLWNQLTVTGALISLRVVDEHGRIRSWLDPNRVPFDRRHVFSMKTENVQPHVTSGTIKRVGLKHIWVRL